jgi:hypothetical protein
LKVVARNRIDLVGLVVPGVEMWRPLRDLDDMDIGYATCTASHDPLDTMGFYCG